MNNGSELETQKSLRSWNEIAFKEPFAPRHRILRKDIFKEPFGADVKMGFGTCGAIFIYGGWIVLSFKELSYNHWVATTTA